MPKYRISTSNITEKEKFSVDYMVYYTIFQNVDDPLQHIIVYPRYIIISDRNNIEEKCIENNPFVLWESKDKFVLKEPMDWFKNRVGNEWYCWIDGKNRHYPYGDSYFRIIEGPKFYPKSSEVKESGVYFLLEDKKGNRSYDNYYGKDKRDYPNGVLFFNQKAYLYSHPRAGENTREAGCYILYTAKEREKQNAEEQAQYAEVRKRALKHFPENVFKSSRVGMKYSDFVGVLQLYSTEAKWNHCTEEEVLKMIVESDVSTDYKGDKIKTIKVGNVKYTFINNWLYRIDKQ